MQQETKSPKKKIYSTLKADFLKIFTEFIKKQMEMYIMFRTFASLYLKC